MKRLGVKAFRWRKPEFFNGLQGGVNRRCSRIERMLAMNNKRDLLKGLSIGVLYGGPSSEREVSIQTGENVARALSSAGHKVQRVLLDGSFSERDARDLGIDVAFLALHGEFGEDGRIQQILENADIPYTGSGIDASALAFDKVLAKRAFEKCGVRTPAWMALDIGEVEKAGGAAAMCMVPPLVIKPAAGGSSLGITIARQEDQITPAIHKAFEFGDTVLMERFIKGRELTVGILAEEALPVTEIKTGGELFDFAAKYVKDTQVVCPAELDPAVAEVVRQTGLAAHKALGCRDYSRVDILLDANNLPWVLEVNTLPGMTSHSLLPQAAKAVGKSYTQLCEEMLRLSLERSIQRQG
jgi:D-alanine-D-alanine ligase